MTRKTATILAFGVLPLGLAAWMKLSRPQFQLGPFESYEKEWAKVDSFEEAGLPESAKKYVERIYTLALKDDNSPQIIKSLIYQAKYINTLEEDGQARAIQFVEKEIPKFRFPTTQIANSVLAELYWRFYESNRWQFQERTETAGFDNEDILTWTTGKIMSKAAGLYELSLTQADSLKLAPIAPFKDIIEKETGSEEVRPTLYDLLAHRAIEFFTNDETGVNQPSNMFVLSAEEAFANARDFVMFDFEASDSTSFLYRAVRLYQQLTDFHAGDHNPEALVDLSLKRLIFARSKSVHPDKDFLYAKALTELAARHGSLDITAEVWYHIALYHQELAAKYNPLDPLTNAYRWEAKEALRICAEKSKAYPGSLGASQCDALADQITTKSVGIQIEEVTSPDDPFRALVTFRNVKGITLRLIKVDAAIHDRTDRMEYEERINHYVGLKPELQWNQSLPDVGDYQSHSVEIKIAGQELGYYLLLASPDPTFPTADNAIAYGFFSVSNMAAIKRALRDQSVSLYVLHRETGKALRGVTVQTYGREYDYNLRKYERKLKRKFTTDAEGYVLIPPTGDYNNFSIELKLGNDQLILSDYFYQYRDYGDDNGSRERTFFFTDRSIYRPGQTVYFKGLMLTTSGDKSEIITGRSTTVTFYDVNSQEVGRQTFTTNDYGTFSGTFIAPAAGLTGQMRIQNESGTAYFSVEEYKRPRFEVKMLPVKESYRLNDTVSISGEAKTYAGSNVDGAKVHYRVVRSANFPYYWRDWWSPWPTSPEMEITSGTTMTDAEGKFTVSFAAIPDLSISRKTKPQFTYRVVADVVDITGETRSAEGNVSVGYVALDANIRVPYNILLDTIWKEEISTKNLNGEFEAASGNIKVYELKQPERIFRDRLWEQPDTFVISKADYYSAFSNDVWMNEDQPENWAKGEKRLDKNFNTAESKEFVMDARTWPQGRYVLEFTTQDKYGEKIEMKRYFTLWSEKAKDVPVNDIFWKQDNELKGEPGETVRFTMGSAEKDVRVLYEIESPRHGIASSASLPRNDTKGGIIYSEWITLSDSRKTIDIPLKEDYRGNIIVHTTWLRHGRMGSESKVVYVPWSNKDLKVEFETFRDKITPGAKEQWKIKISGPGGEKVASEMLAAMYDASLDAFKPHGWSFSIYPTTSWSQARWSSTSSLDLSSLQLHDDDWNEQRSGRWRGYDRLNWFGYEWWYSKGSYFRNGHDLGSEREGAVMMDGERDENDDGVNNAWDKEPPVPSGAVVDVKGKSLDSDGDGMPDHEDGDPFGLASGSTGDIKARTNLNETAFFFPQLETDAEGKIIISFAAPEALTRWKFMGFAHTKDLKYGFLNKETVTQKELMVMPNAPRFLREGDRITFTAKVSNLSDKDLSGEAELKLFDAITMQEISHKLIAAVHGEFPTIGSRTFTAKKGQSALLEWELNVPEGFSAVTYRVVAKAGNFSDGEENALPVLSNRTWVTESLPLPIRGGQTKTFRLEKLLARGTPPLGAGGLDRLTLEFTSNPAWYAVQALPYLMEFPHECSEQIFARYYSNSIASHIANSNPKIKAVFDQWKNTDALVSNLAKNQELKNVILSETPWVLESQSETEQKKRVGLLFDLNNMANELGQALTKLEKAQTPNGGWSWFPGDRDNRYITQHIVTGFGHLDHLGVKSVREDNRTWRMVASAVPYLDARMQEDYDWLVKHKVKMEDDNLGYETVQYLYARSYFLDIELEQRYKQAFEYFVGQAKKYWLKKGFYMQGMIALGLYRLKALSEDQSLTKTSNDILKSLKEHSVKNEELGMYFKGESGWFWYQAPIETQALLIEAFDEIANDQQAVDDMKVWLLKQKQTQSWPTTKSTTEACYALLLRGTDWLATESNVEIVVGTKKIDPSTVKAEAGTGYFKTSWSGNEITPDMGKVTVTKKDAGVSWGALYWQYFEQLDKITSAETPLKLSKTLFLERNSRTGKEIIPLTSSTKLTPGDKVIVRIELRVDRDMEFVHMKDMRASGFEPINVLSQYKWQDGLGYYESTKDAATHFFFSWLPRGTHVFEYPLRVQHRGEFSNGITSIECMYAPEFRAHSEGVRVEVR